MVLAHKHIGAESRAVTYNVNSPHLLVAKRGGEERTRLTTLADTSAQKRSTQVDARTTVDNFFKICRGKQQKTDMATNNNNENERTSNGEENKVPAAIKNKLLKSSGLIRFTENVEFATVHCSFGLTHD